MTPVVILAGGLGTRLREETGLRPKPMIEVGGRPILWHIMKIYGHFGFNDFIIPVGYRGQVIRDFFLNYRDRHSDVSVNLASGHIDRHSEIREGWQVTIVETGLQHQTGGRVKRVAPYLNGRLC